MLILAWVIRNDQLQTVLCDTVSERHHRVLPDLQAGGGRQSDPPHETRAITTTTLNTLCEVLDCRVEDILEYVPDPEDAPAPEN